MQLSVTQIIILTSTQQVFNCLSYVRCLCGFAGKEGKICYLCELIVTACQFLVYFSTSIAIVTMMGNIHGHQSGSGLGKVHLQQTSGGRALANLATHVTFCQVCQINLLHSNLSPTESTSLPF